MMMTILAYIAPLAIQFVVGHTCALRFQMGFGSKIVFLKFTAHARLEWLIRAVAHHTNGTGPAQFVHF